MIEIEFGYVHRSQRLIADITDAQANEIAQSLVQRGWQAMWSRVSVHDEKTAREELARLMGDPTLADSD